MDNQDESNVTDPLRDEGDQERGLRILGRIIARHLRKQPGGSADKAYDRKPDDSPTVMDDV